MINSQSWSTGQPTHPLRISLVLETAWSEGNTFMVRQPID